MGTRNPGFTMYSAPVSPSYMAELRRKFYFPNYLLPSYYNHLSRYNEIRTIKNEDDKIVHETFFDYYITEKEGEKRYTITDKTKNRLDIISLIFYKNPHYWWIIAIANDIIDPMENLKVGTTLRIPDITSLYYTGSMFG